MKSRIAIVGLACEYPDAHSQHELWENVVAGRRAFRAVPPERLRLEDYYSSNRRATDLTYARRAAVIEGYEFDREKFRIVGSTYRSTDLAHWLALDVASRVLEDAGFADAAGLPRDTTGVLIGNTLTGEFSRASVMRLRWPYVRRILNAKLIEDGLDEKSRAEFINDLEGRYKAPFAPTGDETLAGGLSNTIAGRICNFYDLGGGGYTIDGACSSSLLAVANACTGLAIGDLDVAIAGGVDLSLDPFELVGFSRVGALAEGDMRVYDARPTGFLPGEGCGLALLMRENDAIAQHLDIYAVITGWGISSDGSGGLTRPEVEGQRRAVQRAYQKAGYGIDTVGYLEGHGTGTAIGDEVELKSLSSSISDSGAPAVPAVIGSIKANIGHTKAAAGAAGLFKAALAVHHRYFPPNCGLEKPHPVLEDSTPMLRVLAKGEPWLENKPVRAGVSSMGFGGINVHLTMEGSRRTGKRVFSGARYETIAPCQDAELLLLAGENTDDLLRQVEALDARANLLSSAELTDLAVMLAEKAAQAPVRAAIVTASPSELQDQLALLRTWLSSHETDKLDTEAGVFLGSRTESPRLGYLFTGQGSPANLDGGAMRRRFDMVEKLYEEADLPTNSDGIETSVAQPAIVTSSVAALRMLDALGIDGSVAVGHSLGELTAYHWAGVYDAQALFGLARARGRAMSDKTNRKGSMAGIGADEHQVKELLVEGAVIAGLNADDQTVVSGTEQAVADVVSKAAARGIRATLLPVSHAFHSPLMEGAIDALKEHLDQTAFSAPKKTIISTISGSPLTEKDDLKALLTDQLTAPVRFQEALNIAAAQSDLLLEIGPGQVLAGLAARNTDIPVVSIDAGERSLAGLLQAAGAAFAVGVDVKFNVIFNDRFTRPFDLAYTPRFFANPCEAAPTDDWRTTDQTSSSQDLSDGDEELAPGPAEGDEVDVTVVVKKLVAAKTELPMSAISDGSRLLDDLHLNSIAVSQIITRASKLLGLPAPLSPNEYADATIAQVVEALGELMRTHDPAGDKSHEGTPAGVDSWVRSFTVEFDEAPLSETMTESTEKGAWQVHAPADYPLASEFKAALEDTGVDGHLICLPPQTASEQIEMLIQAGQCILERPSGTQVVFVQHGCGAAGFARTLHLEGSNLTTTVIDCPMDSQTVRYVAREVRSARGYTEVRYDNNWVRYTPVLKAIHQKELSEIGLPLDKGDLLLVTGGGKGIAAEAALALAEKTGVRLLLMGRSKPEQDPELKSNLARMVKRGVRFAYISADVTNAAEVRKVLGDAKRSFGSVTGFLHGAGVNVPRLIRVLKADQFRKTMDTKVQGARNVLSAIDEHKLKLFVTFGSIIARTGLRGEADYAVANEWLTRLTEQIQADVPTCRCLAIEWSVWSGLGMGERLGRIESLAAAGVAPITADAGIEILEELLTREQPSVSIVVAGRFGEPPTLRFRRTEPPLLRFVEHIRVHYPQIELIVDAKLSADADPYVNDHVFRGERLFPAVMGLEAMAQTAQTLQETDQVPVFERAQFERPIVIPDDGETLIRVAALARDARTVELVVRCSQTNMAVDHFRAVCSFNQVKNVPGREAAAVLDTWTRDVVLSPATDLYGGVLFHGERFQRLKAYRSLRARECLAELMPASNGNWYGRYLPPKNVLGDPAVRDAAIHSIQACVPNASLLPISVERIEVFKPACTDSRLIHARERCRDGNIYTYDMTVTDMAGHLCERWTGLRLQAMAGTDRLDKWVPSLLGPYLERKAGDFFGGADVGVAIEQGDGELRRQGSHLAIERAVGRPIEILNRPDGKPTVVGDMHISASHCRDITMGVASVCNTAGDIETVIERTEEEWSELLSEADRDLAAVVTLEAKQDISVSATRVWTARECLKKAGRPSGCPLVLAQALPENWVLFKSGQVTIASLATTMRDFADPVAIAILVEQAVPVTE